MKSSRLPSSVPEPSCGEIGLPDYGQAARFESGAHFRGLHKKTRLLVACPGQRERRSPPDPRAISLHEKRPPGLRTRATSRPSPSLSAMFMVTAYDQT
jgi:hypothetical protein